MLMTTEKLAQEHRAALVAFTCALACAVALVPIWSVEFPPLQDYPAHMARMHILANLEQSPALQAIYEIRWQFLPNLVMDVLVPPLSRILPLFDAGRVFISAIIIMWIIGPLALHRALFGRVSFWPLIASFFAYNWCLSKGLLNFAFGAGLSFLVLAAWVGCQNWPALRRLILFSVLSTVLFFCHFIAFAIYVLAIMGYEAGRTFQTRATTETKQMLWHWGLVLGQFIIPLLIFTLLSPTKGEIVLTGSIHWGGLWSRLKAVLSPVLFEWGPIDYLTILFAGAVFLYALITRSIKVHPAFLWTLILLSIVAIVMPTGLDGPGLRHIRIPPVLAALFFAGTVWSGKMPSRAGPTIFALFALLFVTRAAITTDRWQLQDARITEFREEAAKFEEGSSLFLAFNGEIRPDYLRTNANAVLPFLHLADYATIDSSAFSPSLFADLGIQPIRRKGAYEALENNMVNEWDQILRLAHEGQPPDPNLGSADPNLINWPRNFDYVVVVNFEQGELASKDFLSVFHAGSYFVIYKIEKPPISELN